MVFTVYILTLLSNLYYSIKKNDSKIVIFLSFIVILLLISGAGPNYSFWADYHNYELSYSQSVSIGIMDKTEIGYTLLSKVGNLLGLDFFTFRLLLTGAGLVSIYKGVIKKHSYNPHYIILFYMLYQMIIDSEHFRNFIALSILLYSINYLVDNSLSNNIKFIILVLLASSIHTSFLFYILLVFINSKNYKLKISILVTIAILLTALTIINNNRLPFMGIITNIISDQRILSYLASSTNFGYIVLFALQMSNIALMLISKKILSLRDSELIILNNNLNSEETFLKINRFTNLIFWINILSVVYFPLFIIEINMYRIIRNLLILNYIVFSITSYRLKNKSTTKIFFNLLVFLNVILWVYVDLTVLVAPERVLIPFFTENLFF